MDVTAERVDFPGCVFKFGAKNLTKITSTPKVLTQYRIPKHSCLQQYSITNQPTSSTGNYVAIKEIQTQIMHKKMVSCPSISEARWLWEDDDGDGAGVEESWKLKFWVAIINVLTYYIMAQLIQNSLLDQWFWLAVYWKSNETIKTKDFFVGLLLYEFKNLFLLPFAGKTLLPYRVMLKWSWVMWKQFTT